MEETSKKLTFIVAVPVEVEADTPFEALNKVSIPEGAKPVSIGVYEKPAAGNRVSPSGPPGMVPSHKK